MYKSINITILLFCIHVFYAIVQVSAVSVTLTSEKRFVGSEEIFSVNCNVTDVNKIREQNLVFNIDTQYFQLYKEAKIKENKETFLSVNRKFMFKKGQWIATKKFTCSYKDVNDNAASQSATINFAKFEYNNATLSSNGTTLTCSVEVGNDFQHKLYWKRGKKMDGIQEEPSKKDTTTYKTSLKLTEDSLANEGIYECVLDFLKADDVKGSVGVMISVSGSREPVIDKMKNQRLSENEKLEVTCTARGYVNNIIWQLPNGSLVESNNRIDTDTNIVEGTNKLLIRELKFTDRGMYYCVASFDKSNGTATVTEGFFLRVKDSQAALWPFIGIIIEVILLAIIISVCEWKRKASKKSNKNDENRPLQDGVDSEGLRQRSVKA